MDVPSYDVTARTQAYIIFSHQYHQKSLLLDAFSKGKKNRIELIFRICNN